MKLEDTKIEYGGVLRCCLATVALEFKDKEVELGATSACPHCKQTFTLVMWPTRGYYGKPEKHPKEPVWVPDWQLEKKKNG